eukprot:TRINITY_DN699_c0_g1_i15.p1 TRINITY_DN699_c0_g1~~TRINITY_DN699_c0_g1_i15.p1  ORF type:complete len:164 (+),score=36.36 TRINITY_DN699_c0_g1_i15:232-723(+)
MLEKRRIELVSLPKKESKKETKTNKQEVAKAILNAIERRVSNIESELVAIQRLNIIKDSDITKSKPQHKGICFSLAEELDDTEIDERCQWIEARNFDVAKCQATARTAFTLLKSLYKQKDTIIAPKHYSNTPNAKELFEAAFHKASLNNIEVIKEESSESSSQ